MKLNCLAKPKDFSPILSFLWKGHNKRLWGQTIDKNYPSKLNHKKSIIWNGICNVCIIIRLLTGAPGPVPNMHTMCCAWAPHISVDWVCACLYLYKTLSNIWLRGHNWVHFAHRPVYCYLEFKLRYLKNLKLFSVRIKEWFEPIVLRKKKSWRVFTLFKSISFLEKSIFE